jgi:GTP cyclohydrolase I
MKEFNYEAVKSATRDLLIAMGEDPDREGLKETPRRVAGYWKELLEGNNYTNAEIAEKFSKEFEVGYDPMVTEYIKNVYSHCEHHLALMFNGNVIVGYLPVKNENGTFKVLGLSKINRIVDLCSKRLQLQEKLASDIAECISLATGSKEVYVNLHMSHGCVSARGPKSESNTNVTYMTKELRENKECRNEFERKATEMILRNK